MLSETRHPLRLGFVRPWARRAVLGLTCGFSGAGAGAWEVARPVDLACPVSRDQQWVRTPDTEKRASGSRVLQYIARLPCSGIEEFCGLGLFKVTLVLRLCGF